MSASSTSTPLGTLIADHIRTHGSITVADYMALVLSHPRYGYYMTRDPFGAGGDFVTAPEVSQIFGEILGLWAACVWMLMGKPKPFHLVELGPGRGTLMADAVRALGVVPDFLAACDIVMVETSPVLAALQKRTLEKAGATVQHVSDIDALPDGPVIILANEFFDALPVHQFVAHGGRWHERMVELSPEGLLQFGYSPPLPDSAVGRLASDVVNGAIVERSFVGERIALALAARLAQFGGAALMIDYGYDEPTANGDTLQAVRRHSFCSPLDFPGECDLTAHVNFNALRQAALPAGVDVYGAITQHDLLVNLGIRDRAERLKLSNRSHRDDIDRAVQRLIDAQDMGTLFLAMCLTSHGLTLPPPFSPHQHQ